MSVTQERGERREWLSCLQDDTVAVIGSWVDLECPFCSPELSVKQLPSQDFQCRGRIGFALK